MKFRNNKDDDKDEEEDGPKLKAFYGPPTSCEELGKLGYTLNGYYLVKGKDNFNRGRVRTVYCQFKQPQWMKHQGKATNSLDLL